MRVEPVETVDFETKGIESRPDYPPVPVGVSIKEWGKAPKYYAWGHPTENNCTKSEAKKALKKVWRSKRPKLFHNAKFDVDVAVQHMDMAMLPWHQIHDTEFLAFLHNPHDDTLSLKPLSDKYLDMPPEEQDAVKEWILEHVFTSEKSSMGKVVLASTKPEGYFKVPPSKTGKFICYAPGKLVGKYANGDTARTEKLYKFLYPYIITNGMQEAYNRERRLMPVLLKSETAGVAIYRNKLRKDLATWEASIEITDQWIRRRLKAKDLDIDKPNDLADAIEEAGKVDEWILTDKGNRSTAKENLVVCITDKLLVQVLDYRSTMLNSIRNFGKPWLAMANKTGGFIHTNWNQVRTTGERGQARSGARTGRLSSNPNFQNVSKRPRIIKLPKWLLDRVAPLPYMREYIKPRKGHVLNNRDYSQQELRILGHFEDGVLLQAYNENPFMDIHDYALELVNDLLMSDYPRKPIKTMGFGLVYGMGLALLAKNMGTDIATARVLKKAYLSIFPGLRDLIDELIELGKAGDCIHTWGGREYYVEPARYDKNLARWRTFEYKLLNVLIQGSAADCTKEAMIRADDALENSILLLNVHDEIMIDSPKEIYKGEMKILKDAMESVEFDVPMISDGKYSRTSWGKMVKFRE